MTDDLDPLEQHLVDALRALPAPRRPRSGVPAEAEAAWRAGIESRAIDHAARWLQSQRLGFYTIGSAGHESNALVALALRTDRPGAPPLPVRRLLPRAGRRRPAGTASGTSCSAWPPRRTSRSPAAATRCSATRDLSRDPADVDDRLASSAGRRGSRSRSSARGSSRVESAWPRDAVVVCSFGDASLNHATAQAALNAAAYLAYGGQPLPLLFVCEDNGLGISVPTHEAWVEQSLYGRPELAIERADGDDPARAARDGAGARSRGCASTGIRRCCTCEPCASSAMPAPTSRPPIGRARRSARTTRAIRCSPSAAGSSPAGARTARISPRSTSRRVSRIRGRALEATRRPQTRDRRADVMRPLAPPRPGRRRRARGEQATPSDERLTLAQAINAALARRARAASPRRSCSARTSPSRAASTA